MSTKVVGDLGLPYASQSLENFGRVEHVLAIVCPGQGSQTPGFLNSWLEEPALASRLAELSVAAGKDLAWLGTEADEETIKDTAHAQRLIVAAGLLAADALFGEDGAPAEAVYAGHSVGEITASAMTGIMSYEDALRFVALRADEMAKASNAQPTGMAAVLGGEHTEVIAAIEAAGAAPANMNGGGQIVAAGSLESLEKLNENPPAKARVIPLKVAGAFHTDYMASAVDPLRELAETITAKDPRGTLLTNAGGSQVDTGTHMLRLLVDQVTRPVDWESCQETMKDLGVTGLIELTPAGTLTGLARRGLKGVKTFALKTPDQLDDARAFISEHSGN